MEKIKILVADDHPIMREGFKLVLEGYPEFSKVTEAQNGEEALSILLKDDFDIATLDVEMPVMGGFDVARKILEKKINTKIIFLTMYKDEYLFREAMDTGALGYVLKENAVDDIIECIKCVVKGEHYVSPALSHFIFNRQKERKELEEKSPSINNLTKAERTILRLIAESKTTKEIGVELFISYKTVENHRANIARKLNLQGAHSLVKFAITNKSLL
jgi:DNA-binding NarL/FixJ family response regulator